MNTSTTQQTKAATQTPTTYSGVMEARQSPLATQYRDAPERAWTIDIASTGHGKAHINDPLHNDVTVADVTIAMGVHTAVGGDSDAPVPGELLSAALASCMDSTLRIVANRLSIQLTHLEVIVSAEIDVRGTLRLNPKVPVAFQKMHLSVAIDTVAGTPPHMVKALLSAAKASCVVMQTLKNPPEISAQVNIAG